MAYIGLIRPIILSIPTLAELQIISLMKTWTGEAELPPNGEMHRTALEQKKQWDVFFKDTSRRIGNLVQPFEYIFDLFKTFNLYPDPVKLFKRNPKSFFYVLTSPYHAAFSLLNDPKYDKHVYETLKKHTPKSWQFTPVTLALSKLLLVDRISNFIAEIKSRWQCIYLKRKARD